MEDIKQTCPERCCGWHGRLREALSAPNPFEEGDVLYACPKCKGLDLRYACDEPGCWEAVSCGTPTPQGYRRTCDRHAP